MNIALIADTFAPSKTSGAIQLHDLATEFVKRGDSITVLVADPTLESSWKFENNNGVDILRLKTFNIKSQKYLFRAIAELLMPFCMLINLLRSPRNLSKWDGIIWYSPSIFFGPLVQILKVRNKCKSYLILRDIFPEWAFDMGLLKRGIVYGVLKLIARYQYRLADTIGIQTYGNNIYFKNLDLKHTKLEVLQNWLSKRPILDCSINLIHDIGKRSCIFVYIGNMGVAQNSEVFLTLADYLNNDKDCAFVYVGRGTELPRLREIAAKRNLKNVYFYDEINSEEIPGLLNQCHIGLVSLSQKHKSHNIPGKFLSYLTAGLPVLISVNRGNDLEALVREYELGIVIEDESTVAIECAGKEIMAKAKFDKKIKERAECLFRARYSPAIAVDKIKMTFDAH